MFLYNYEKFSNNFLKKFVSAFVFLTKFKKLLSEKLRDLWDTMPRHWSLRFFIITMLLTGHYAMPVVIFYRECYGFERAFFTLRCFLPCTPSC